MWLGNRRWAAATVLVGGLLLAGCSGPSEDSAAGPQQGASDGAAESASSGQAVAGTHAPAPSAAGGPAEGYADGGPAPANPGSAPSTRHAPGKAGANRPSQYQTKLPKATAIEGCGTDSCKVFDAITFKHPAKGALTLVLYSVQADSAAATLAVLDAHGETAQILKLDAYYATSADKFHFLRIPVDSTGMVFLAVPGENGYARALRPLNSGYFELFDFSPTVQRCIGEGMTVTNWGLFDKWGNYGLTIQNDTNDCQAHWDGKKYAMN